LRFMCDLVLGIWDFYISAHVTIVEIIVSRSTNREIFNFPHSGSIGIVVTGTGEFLTTLSVTLPNR
jgi:hypothetical protein